MEDDGQNFKHVVLLPGFIKQQFWLFLFVENMLTVRS